jgi:hypothetical protein
MTFEKWFKYEYGNYAEITEEQYEELKDAFNAGMQVEREMCAKLCEPYENYPGEHADAIRKRS